MAVKQVLVCQHKQLYQFCFCVFIYCRVVRYHKLIASEVVPDSSYYRCFVNALHYVHTANPVDLKS